MNWTMKSIDVKASFLDSILDEDIYIGTPQGLQYLQEWKVGEIGKLNAAIYGLVQASRAFYVKMRMFLTQKLGFTECASEPCLLTNKNLVIGLYVDDLLMSGPKGSHDGIWNKLRDGPKKIDLDQPELLSRFLGRSHVAK